MEAAKKSHDPESAVCPYLSNHEIFEKWRVVDTSTLSSEKRAEFEEDKAESNRRYDAAFSTVLSRTSDAEMASFWEPFGVRANAIEADIVARWSEHSLPDALRPSELDAVVAGEIREAGVVGADEDRISMRNPLWARSSVVEDASDANAPEAERISVARNSMDDTVNTVI